MQEQLQLVFSRVEETKKKIKDIRRAYKEALESSEEYKNLTDKIKTMRERKKQIENVTKESFASELTKLDDYKIDVESDMVMISDLALNTLMKGETVQVVDEYNNTYEPVFKVSFKKS